MYRLPVPLSPARPPFVVLKELSRLLPPARPPVCVFANYDDIYGSSTNPGPARCLAHCSPSPPLRACVYKSRLTLCNGRPRVPPSPPLGSTRGTRDANYFRPCFIRVEVKRTVNVCKTTRSKMEVRSRIMRDTTKFAGINPQWNVLFTIHERAEGRIYDRGGRPTDSETIFFFRPTFRKTVLSCRERFILLCDDLAVYLPLIHNGFFFIYKLEFRKLVKFYFSLLVKKYIDLVELYIWKTMIAIEDVSIKSGLEALSKMLRGKCSRFINIMHTSKKYFFKLKTVNNLFTHDPLQMT